MSTLVAAGLPTDVSICQSCGACCAYSRTWPRFTMESDADIGRIAAKYIDSGMAGMRCDDDRCSALSGEVGVSTSCAIYPVRPDVCRACLPGDEACTMARQKFELSPVEPRD